MRDTEHPIDSYLTQLARRLHLPAAERDQVLAEVRGHLEERARALHQTGVSEEHAERQAVLVFGPVGRISQELRASHPIPWGKWRWLVGIVTGAVVTWALWLIGTVPVTVYSYARDPVYQCPPSPRPITPPLSSYCFPGSPVAHVVPLSLTSTLIQSSPLGSNAFFAYLTFGWLWLLPFLVLYLVLPFRWGRRAQHWWVPGLAYGLGTWLSAPWFVFELVNNMVNFSAEGWIIALALPLALAAGFVGWLWRERSAVALDRAQMA